MHRDIQRQGRSADQFFTYRKHTETKTKTQREAATETETETETEIETETEAVTEGGRETECRSTE